MKKLVYVLLIVSMLTMMSSAALADDPGTDAAAAGAPTSVPAPTATPKPAPTDTPVPAQAPAPTDTEAAPAPAATDTEVAPAPAATDTEAAPAPTDTEVVPTDTEAPAEPTEEVAPTDTEVPAPPEETATEEAQPTEVVTATVEAPPTEVVTATVEATPTEVVTATVEATPTEVVTATVEATPTEEVTATVEATPTEVVTPTVEAEISHIAIRDAAGGFGSQVVSATLTTADTLVLYAAAYDKDGNYVKDVPVNWSTTGSLDAVEATGVISFTFAPTTADTEGTIKADDGQGISHETDLITVAPAPVVETPISHITIRDAADGFGDQVVTTTVTVSDTLVLYAAAYDKDGNFLKDVPADWTTTDNLDVITATGAISFTFAPATADTAGTIKADDGEGQTHETGVISVVAPAVVEVPVHHIAVRDAADGFGSLVVSRTLTLTDTLVLYAAAYDKDGNYLKDVPANWATTGTLDPITTTEAISVTFAPLTGGTSGTITADAGNELVYETEGITVESGLVAKSVSAQLAGTWTTDKIAVQNLSSSTANVAIDLYDESGNPAQDSINLSIDGNGVASVSSGSISNNGRFSAVVSSDQEVAVLVQNSNYTSQLGDFYLGFDANRVAQKLYFPQADCQYSSGWTSKFHVQNVMDSAQTVRMSFYKVGETTPAVQHDQSVAAYASHTFDLDDDAATIGGLVGYVIVEGLSGNVAATVDHLRETSPATAVIGMTNPGTPGAWAGRTLILPTVHYKYSGGWSSNMNVLNADSSMAHVTLTFTDRNTAHTFNESQDVAPGAVWHVDMNNTFRNVGGVTSFVGSCLIQSTGADVLAAVASSKYVTGGSSVGYNYSAANPDEATTSLAAPLLYKYAGGSGSNTYISDIQVYNVDSNATVTVTMVRDQACTAGGASWASFQMTGSGVAGKSQTFSLTKFSNANGSIPNGWYGSAFVSGGGAKVISTSSSTSYGLGLSDLYVGQNY